MKQQKNYINKQIESDINELIGLEWNDPKGKQILDAIILMMKRALWKGDYVHISRVGTWSVPDRPKQRLGYLHWRYKTDKFEKVKPRKLVKFLVSDQVLAALNPKPEKTDEPQTHKP